jgi:hypothetical protein
MPIRLASASKTSPNTGNGQSESADGFCEGIASNVKLFDRTALGLTTLKTSSEIPSAVSAVAPVQSLQDFCA